MSAVATRPRDWYSARQRTITLTFPTPEAAQAWDDAGRPLDAMLTTEVEG